MGCRQAEKSRRVFWLSPPALLITPKVNDFEQDFMTTSPSSAVGWAQLGGLRL